MAFVVSWSCLWSFFRYSDNKLYYVFLFFYAYPKKDPVGLNKSIYLSSFVFFPSFLVFNLQNNYFIGRLNAS